MTNQFIYNGKRSYDDMCLIITETPPFVIAERDVTYTAIPGRSGDLIEDNGRYNNITIPYTVAVLTNPFDLPLLVKKIAAWLGTAGGYFILSDTYDPNYFRYARYSGNLNIADLLLKIGTAKLNFNCKPFKYSFDGQHTVTLGSSGTLYNPEDFPSVPYMKLTGSGDIMLSIGSSYFAFSNVDGYIEVDGEIMAAYKGAELQNDKISFSAFPVLEPGMNKISASGNVSKIEIIPRWCAL